MNFKNNEKLHKILSLVVAIILLAAVGVLFHKNITDKKNAKKEAVEKTSVLSKNKEKKVKEQNAKNITKKNRNKSKILPTSKELILKKAQKISGRVDPFAYSSRMVAAKATFDDALLPPAPGMPKNFQKISKDGFRIKGFIGDKVIVNVNGLEESLAVAEKFQDIRVLSIDSENLTAEFLKRGKRVVKKIEKLDNNSSQIDIIRK